MTEPQAWFQCQGLSRSRSLGLAPFSLTGANRVILTSLRGRQAPEPHRLVLQRQLSTWSKLGCRVVPVTSHHAASPGGEHAQRQDAGRGEVGTELLRTKQAWKQSREAKISSRMSPCVMIFFNLLPRSLDLIILHLPLFDCYLPLLVAYVEPAAYVGHQR